MNRKEECLVITRDLSTISQANIPDLSQAQSYISTDSSGRYNRVRKYGHQIAVGNEVYKRNNFRLNDTWIPQ
ncbi:hypothetical protein KIN20_031076 [Parelaphostrongylus tenuis]|uniref:Uncharacterized protein n=1 Tax=Parelaphostrongylus tenuis TaxID=148309 RepID=A0AAD5R517_PARTN|nr:hypothetical protein KIN20_031076 [Parelaphostrongylus tenuis]